MTDERLGQRRRSHGGQILPIFALGLVVLLATVALAIDVSSAYAARRLYRAVADASSLAGAQDLQTASRAITNANRTNAREHALQVLKDRLGASGDPAAGPCNGNVTNYSVDFSDCSLPGTPYQISIKTPSPTCVSCDPDHAVQVTIRNPSFSLSFSRVLGFNSWNVSSTSVAGLAFSAKYALVTLQPPNPRHNGTDANLLKDISVSGNNTVLNVLQGDIGTNTSAATTLQGLIQLADTYFIDHVDDLSVVGDTWTKPDGIHPVGREIPLIPDPNYMYPSFSGAPAPFTSQSQGVVPCPGPDFPTDYATLLGAAPICYQPGVYADPQSGGFNVGTGEVAYLMPGAYSFTTGMRIRGTLAGGLIDGGQGVVLEFPQTTVLDANNALNFLLNVGGSSCSGNSCRAAPAVDFAGTEVKTPDGFVLSIEVTRDVNCFSGTSPIISDACAVNQNGTVQLAGNGQLAVAGVIYGPSDNMQIHANQTVQTGFVGQIISWSVVYTGGATLNQSYPGGREVGVVRLDAACTTPATPCTNP